jgi:hypothetical protein
MKSTIEASEREARIVWLEDEKRFPYLREDVTETPLRVRSLERCFCKDGRLVGYAELDADAKSENGFFSRRYWWVADRDMDGAHFGRADYVPCEGVIPSSIATGKASKRGRCNPREA